jgi:hypothetical protein
MMASSQDSRHHAPRDEFVTPWHIRHIYRGRDAAFHHAERDAYYGGHHAPRDEFVMPWQNPHNYRSRYAAFHHAERDAYDH